MEIVKKKIKKQKASELIKRTEIENTPFTVVTIKEESFGSMGKYRITEIYKTEDEVKKELENITWNRIVQVMLLITESLKENEINK